MFISNQYLYNQLYLIQRELKHMSTQLDTLTAQVSTNTAELKAAGTDPVKLQALADTLKQEDDKLAQAVVDNTPAK
jgi:hypothetical protein